MYTEEVSVPLVKVDNITLKHDKVETAGYRELWEFKFVFHITNCK